MTERISNFFGLIFVRLALIVGAMAAMTATVLFIGLYVFQSIGASMSSLQETRLPALAASSSIAQATDMTNGILADILVATDRSTLDALETRRDEVVAELGYAINSLPAGQGASLGKEVDDVNLSLKALIEARSAKMASAEDALLAVRTALAISTEALNLLEEASDTAYFNLVVGGDETIEAVGKTLNQLIEEDFMLYQHALGAQSELNLLSGLALARAQASDMGLMVILDDLVSAADGRLLALLEFLEQAPAAQALVATSADARALFVTQGQRARMSEILSMRTQVDAQLASFMDDVYFDLLISSEDVKVQNETSIRALLDDQVSSIRENAELSGTTRAFLAIALQVAVAPTRADLELQANSLMQSGEQLQAIAGSQPADIAEKLQEVLSILDPSTGIVATIFSTYEARDKAAVAAGKATNAVQRISDNAVAIGSVAKREIRASAADLSRQVAQAQIYMEQAGWASLLLVLIAPFLTWFTITRPLNIVTGVTENLAAGDLSPVTGLERSKGEIRRLGAALDVFRSRALERIALQDAEQQRQSEALAAERRAQQAEQQAAVREQEARLAKEQDQRERAAKEARREEEQRAILDAERTARAKEQELVVAELAKSLHSLSLGDLTRAIDTEFPAGFEPLRQDYNAAVLTLSEMIRKIGFGAGSIDSSSSEVAAASRALADRTEKAAATLEETAAALNEATGSVASAAQGASEATRIVGEVKSGAMASQKVMQDAVAAVGEIAQSSSEISTIVEVIDGIAFQTNLLAINAGVEAARAGEAGRGFAVVASEVRTLAHRCSDAALQINALISGASEQVERGVSLIDHSSEAMKTILGGISDVSQHVSQIAVSAQEQSCSIEEINTAVSELDRATQHNAAMFEETTAASQALRGEAGNLAQIVAGFVTSAQEPKAPEPLYQSVG